MLGALHAPRRVSKIRRDAPQRHKQPAPLRQTVIARRRPPALRTASPYSSMWLHHDLNRFRSPVVAMHTHFAVYEAHETLHEIQNRLNLQLNGWSPLGLCLPENCRLTQCGDRLFFSLFWGDQRPSPTGPARPESSLPRAVQEAARRPPSTPGLSRRSGRIPAEPYPPIKPLHCRATADRDEKPTIHSGRKRR